MTARHNWTPRNTIPFKRLARDGIPSRPASRIIGNLFILSRIDRDADAGTQACASLSAETGCRRRLLRLTRPNAGPARDTSDIYESSDLHRRDCGQVPTVLQWRLRYY